MVVDRRSCEYGLSSTTIGMARLWFSSGRSRWWLETTVSTEDAWLGCTWGAVTDFMPGPLHHTCCFHFRAATES